MLEIEKALSSIIEKIFSLETEEVSLSEALNRFASKPVRAHIPLPGFDNSSMDGYAILAEDSRSAQPLKVIAEQPAGLAFPLSLKSGEAIRIFTGAPIPTGADAVIMQEDVEVIEDPTDSSNPTRRIRCLDPVRKGENIRVIGADVCVGQLLIEAGDRLSPTKLALLASQGFERVSVHRQPRLAIVTTGDELVQPGQPLKSGQLYNSNAILLQTLVAQLGISNVSLHHLADHFESTKQLLEELISSSDFMILSGGVSVGDHDHIKPALKSLGYPPNFWRINMKPGKPLLHTVAGSCHLFGLPGNPVSSYVTFQLFVRPSLLKAMGASTEELNIPGVSARLTQALDNHGDRPHFVRGSYQASTSTFTPIGLQQSHALFGLSRSNALLRIEPNQSLPENSPVQVLLP